jgi:hypothetical protein
MQTPIASLYFQYGVSGSISADSRVANGYRGESRLNCCRIKSAARSIVPNKT